MTQNPSDLDEAGIIQVVNAFYDKIRVDPLLGPVFAAAIPDGHWPRHLGAMYDFWSAMMLGTRRYAGRPLPKHLALPGLQEAHFLRWLDLFRETVCALCPPEVAALFMERASTVAENFQRALAHRRGDPAAFATQGPPDLRGEIRRS